MSLSFCALPFLVIFVCSLCASVSPYLIGTGIADVTGPAAEINMMGYAKMSQKTYGIHMRLFSRAFIVGEETSLTRTVFVSVDCGMISQNVKTKVSQELKKKYGILYSEKNVVLSATHTHSGPAGFHQYLLFDITSLGFVKESFEALVTGILKSIDMAHFRMKKGKIFGSSGDLLNANINRSPTSYLRNPAEERRRYNGNTDKTMTLIKFIADDGEEMGSINWFAVHGTSMNNTNGYISGDNKGYASQLFERAKNGAKWPHKPSFVAAFAQANEGDVSPNTAGPRCLDTGLPCDQFSSTCNGNTKYCVAFGPGKDMLESMKIIGRRQFEKAKELYDAAKVELVGNITFRHQYLNMSGQVVTLSNGTKVSTCYPAMGYSFAAGTTDGPGEFDFKQGTTSQNPFWNIISSLIKKPSKRQIACHAPKPILINTGEISWPYLWQASIVETQILKIGQMFIIAVPGEFTTMSGRRVREAVLSVANQHQSKGIAVIAGLSNTYADYITTFEEYQAQRYEAASTIHGPHTLEAYIQQYKALTDSMFRNSNGNIAPGPTPPYFDSKLPCLVPPVIFDRAPLGKKYGEVLMPPKTSYRPGQTVSVTMVSGNPRNNLLLGSSFMDVEKLDITTGNWDVAFTDAHHETKFKWTRKSVILGTSQVELMWDIPSDVLPGVYRIMHRGFHKKLLPNKIEPYEGYTAAFHVFK